MPPTSLIGCSARSALLVAHAPPARSHPNRAQQAHMQVLPAARRALLAPAGLSSHNPTRPPATPAPEAPTACRARALPSSARLAATATAPTCTGQRTAHSAPRVRAARRGRRCRRRARLGASHLRSAQSARAVRRGSTNRWRGCLTVRVALQVPRAGRVSACADGSIYYLLLTTDY